MNLLSSFLILKIFLLYLQMTKWNINLYLPKTKHLQTTIILLKPPTKKKYKIMKDPAFLSSPVYPPKTPTKPQLSTNRDEYLTPILSTNQFSFKSQSTSLYLHPTDYTFKLYDKNQDFFTSIASEIMAPYQYWF